MKKSPKAMANKKITDEKLQAGAEKALKEAVREVIEDHRRSGRPVIVWRNGKVVKVPASQLARKRA